MNKLFKFTFLLIIISSLFLGCKKYPDDDKRYWFKSPIKRLSEGSYWNLLSYDINGGDFTDSIVAKYQTLYPNTQRLGMSVNATHKTNIDFGTAFGTCNMAFEDHKDKLKITITSLKSGAYNYFINNSTDWEIGELTVERLEIKSTINGNNYELTFTSAIP